MSMIRSARRRLSIFGELWAFLWCRKVWWMAPLFVMLLLLSLLVVFTEGSAMAPFIYALF